MPETEEEKILPVPASAWLDKAGVLAEGIVKGLIKQNRMIAAAESCTAGLASDFITRIPGASGVFWGSFVTYTIDAKIKMLGVPEELITKYGAVSRQVASAMALGTLEKSGAFWAFSVTGLAGPGGDGRVPVGTVWIGISGRDGDPPGSFRHESKMYFFSGERNEIREAAAAAVLEELSARIFGKPEGVDSSLALAGL